MESLPLLFLAYYWDPGDIKHIVYHSVGTISNIWQRHLPNCRIMHALSAAMQTTHGARFLHDSANQAVHAYEKTTT